MSKRGGRIFPRRWRMIGCRLFANLSELSQYNQGHWHLCLSSRIDPWEKKDNNFKYFYSCLISTRWLPTSYKTLVFPTRHKPHGALPPVVLCRSSYPKYRHILVVVLTLYSTFHRRSRLSVYVTDSLARISSFHHNIEKAIVTARDLVMHRAYLEWMEALSHKSIVWSTPR